MTSVAKKKRRRVAQSILQRVQSRGACVGRKDRCSSGCRAAAWDIALAFADCVFRL